MKLGLFGGTFDPIHNAHLLIAQYVKDVLSLDKIIFIPTSVPPHKNTISTSNLRLKMVEAAIAHNPDFECSKIEIERSGKSYSYDTICALKERHQLIKEQIFWIIGSDNLAEFHTWYRPHEILNACNIVVFPRQENENDLGQNEFYSRVLYLKDAPMIEISSSEIRNKVRDVVSIKDYVPAVVEKVIAEEKLYC